MELFKPFDGPGDKAHLLDRAHLWQQDRGGCQRRHRQQVTVAGVGVRWIDAHDRLGAAEVEGAQRVRNGLAGQLLIGRCDGVLQVEDQSIRAAARGLGEHGWLVARDVQQAAAQGQWSCSSHPPADSILRPAPSVKERSLCYTGVKMEPSDAVVRRLRPASVLPFLVWAGLLAMQLISPDRAWSWSLVGFSVMLLIAYAWARSLRDHVTAERHTQGTWVVAGDELVERFTLGQYGVAARALGARARRLGGPGLQRGSCRDGVSAGRPHLDHDWHVSAAGRLSPRPLGS